MIPHRSDFFGFRTLTRLRGSAVAKGLVPAMISTAILVISIFAFDRPLDENDSSRVVLHPYVIQVMIMFFTFLITYRANFAYQRYWEGATSVHLMLSKWLDVGINMASYHYQCKHFDDIRPPSFGKNAKLRNLTREREREEKMNMQKLQSTLDVAMEQSKQEKRQEKMRFYERLFSRSVHNIKETFSTTTSTNNMPGEKIKKTKKQQGAQKPGHRRDRTLTKNINLPELDVPYRANIPRRTLLHASERSDGSYRPSQREIFTGFSEEEEGGSDSSWTQRDPSLFLQEMAHLISLLSAVAMSTLRRDIEGIEPPLVEHIPGRAWPPVDPDQLGDEIRVQYHEDSKVWRVLYFLLGMSRSNRHRTLYNAARPFRVLGGVSDSEVKLLNETRGPYAKVMLCSMWVQEFISREYLAGSTGDVAPPIISRVYQFLSDGTIGYNQARKIAYVPHPFPHTQLTVLYILVTMFIFPLLMWSFTNNTVYAIVLNFITVLCFVGLHEVARELEAPFENVPNDIPLNNFQAQFNEALIQMYAGFHPDSWWQITDEVKEMDLPPLDKEVEGQTKMRERNQTSNKKID